MIKVDVTTDGRIIEDSDTPEIIIKKIQAIRAERRDQMHFPALFVLEGYNWQTGAPLDRNSPDYAEVKARQDQLTEMDRERSMRAWGAEMRGKYPQWLAEGTIEEVMAQCQTPQQKAQLLLRQAGNNLDNQWFSPPEFQALVAEIRRIANAPEGTTPESVPHDIYTPVIALTRDLSREPRMLRQTAHEGEVHNGSHLVAAGINSFISGAIKAGLIETSASRRPRGPSVQATQQGVEHPAV